MAGAVGFGGSSKVLTGSAIERATDMSVDVKPKADLTTGVRINVLCRVIEDLYKDLGGDMSLIDTIRRGIIEVQALKAVEIHYLNKEGNRVGRVSIEIDWAKHMVLAGSERGEPLDVTFKKSIAEQMSQIVRYTEELRNALAVTSVRIIWRYASDVHVNQAAGRSFDQALHFRGWSTIQAGYHGDRHLEFSGDPEEVFVVVDHSSADIQTSFDNAYSETEKLDQRHTELLLHQYEGQFLDFGPNGTAVTTLETENGEITEVHFRDTLLRGQNIAPGSRFTYAIYDTGSGSRSEIRPFTPTWPSYVERKQRAQKARIIVEGLATPNADEDH